MSLTLQDYISLSRINAMKRGMEALEQWMSDTVQKPLLEYIPLFLHERDLMAKNLVDAQLGKMAQRLRLLELNSTEESKALFFDQWCFLLLLCQYWKRWDDLSQDLQLNVLYQSGMQFTKKHRDQLSAVQDQFYVLLMEIVPLENLRQRTVWLWAIQQQRYFLVLDFAFGNQSFDTTYDPGKFYSGSVTPFPFAGSQRCWVNQLNQQEKGNYSFLRPLISNLDSLSERMTLALKVHPFIEAIPAVISLQSWQKGKEWFLVDSQQQTISRLKGDPHTLNTLYAACYYEPTLVVGMWSRQGFQPFAIIEQDEWFDLSSKENTQK